jgi:hypothetical protein
MSLRLVTETTPARDPEDLLKVRNDGVKYSFRIELGETVFSSSWFFGNEQRIAAHLEQVQMAFAQWADKIEVVR